MPALLEEEGASMSFPFQGGTGGLSNLFKYESASSGSIPNGSVITGLSYEIPANSLSPGNSFRLVLISTAAFAAELCLDTVQGTIGTVVKTGAASSTIAMIIDFICVSTGAAGVLVASGFGQGSGGAAPLAPVALTINTTVNNWLEVFNEQGAAETFTNYAMLVDAT